MRDKKVNRMMRGWRKRADARLMERKMMMRGALEADTSLKQPFALCSGTGRMAAVSRLRAQQEERTTSLDM